MNTEENVKQHGFYLSEALAWLMKKLEAENRVEEGNAIVDALVDGINQANEKHKAGTLTYGEIREEFDRVIGEDITHNQHAKKITCKRGCNFCCYVKVDITIYEAKRIIEYCKEKGIDINWDYVQAQVNANYDEKQWILDKGLKKCEFLRNGECSIYEVRPFACMKHYSVDDPAKCNTDIPYTPFAKPMLLHSEILIAALWNAAIESGTLPQMILKAKQAP